MPYKKLERLQQQHGDLHQIIPAIVNQHGQIRAGQALGVLATTINKWLKQNGYERRTQYVRHESEGQ
jgi:hypothetical protein